MANHIQSTPEVLSIVCEYLACYVVDIVSSEQTVWLLYQIFLPTG
jgi:hypothetical protein